MIASRITTSLVLQTAIVFLSLAFGFSFDATMEFNEDSRTFANACSSIRNFSNICHKVLTSETEENAAYSPFSLHVILSLLSHGAREATATLLKTKLFHPETDMLIGYKHLISSLNSLKDVELNVANTIYIQDKVHLFPKFVTTSAEIFGADVSQVNFKEVSKALIQINSWVAEKTNDKIQDIISLDDINEDTRIVMINALYFKSCWLNKFDTHGTTTQNFHNINKKVKHVSMMFKSSNFSHGILKELNARVIEIPYKNEDFSMVILLPNDNDDLRSLEQKLDWDTVLNANFRRSKVKLFLPKFKLEVKLNLKQSLKKLGIGNILQDGADFSGITETPLKVSRVVQKVFIEVDEEGSEAAAATGVQMRLRRCLSEEPEEFRVDRPFVFVIRYKRGNVPLFVGSVRDIGVPTEKDEL